MKLFLYDEEGESLESLRMICEAQPDSAVAGIANSVGQALTFFAKQPDLNVAFLDYQTSPKKAALLADELRKLRTGIVILYTTADLGQTANAIREKADYVLFKPYRPEDVADALGRAELLMARQKKRLYGKMLGTFDLQLDGKSIRFRSAKARELMALLICYVGKPLSIHELVNRLWDGNDDADVTSVGYRNVIKSLTATLADYGLESILIRSRGYCRLDIRQIDCDYYAYVRGNRLVRSYFQGVFLPEYSWAEQYIYPMQRLKEMDENPLEID